jgi:hypothetical protein
VVNHVWGTKWNTFAHHIEVRGLSVTLDALSYFYSRENPEFFLEDQFLSKLRKEFESLLREILESDLSPDLKKILVGHIEDILKSIHRYWIDGTEGLVAETKLFLVDFVKNESKLQAKDKQNPLYKRAQAFLINLIIYLTPTPYDIIGSAPDIQDYWKPQFEELIQNSQQVEAVLSETDTIQEAFDKASHLLKSSKQKALSGKGELKSLPPSKELPEDDSENEDENNTE